MVSAVRRLIDGWVVGCALALILMSAKTGDGPGPGRNDLGGDIITRSGSLAYSVLPFPAFL